MLLVSGGASANVQILRRADGKTMLVNVGSGWTVGGHAPSDAYLVSRRDSPTPFDEAIRHHAGREGVDERLVRSVVLVESNFNHRAVSPKGARGLMQLMPATARRYGVADSFNPHENIRGGVRYLSDLLAMFRGDVTLALAAYNAGEGAVLRYSGVPPYSETQEYVRRALVAYGGRTTGGPVLGGGFKGVDTASAPARPRPARPAGAPVKLRNVSGSLVISNVPASAVARTGRPPVLGRVAGTKETEVASLRTAGAKGPFGPRTLGSAAAGR